MDKSDIYDIFDEGGLLDQHLEGYEFREGQLEMALTVSRAYSEGAIAAIEAGTGIGKSFAYLVPALLWAQDNPSHKSVVATATINLQRQLFEKDLEQLFTILNRRFNVALVMGRSNYLCIRRLQEKVAEEPLIALDGESELAILVKWSQESETGLRSECPIWISEELWSQVCSDGELCSGYQCHYNKDCFFFKSRKKAAEASLIITNHHLLFSDAHARLEEGLTYNEEAILPPFHHLIIDEAHNIERNATDFFTITYNDREIYRLMGRLKGLGSRRRGLLEVLAPYGKEEAGVDQIERALTLIGETLGYIEAFLVGFMGATKGSSLLVEPHHEEEFKALAELSHTLNGYSTDLVGLTLSFLEKASIPEELSSRERETIVATMRIAASAQALAKFVAFDRSREEVFWIEIFGGGAKRRIYTHVSPLSVGEALQNSIFAGLASVVCTSATLDLGDDFNYWSSRVGLPLPNSRLFIKEVHNSPFDFKNNLLLLTPSDAPFFSEQLSEEYQTYVTETIYDALLASNGGALLLFTSYKMLEEVALALRPRLEKFSINLLVQGERDRYQLLREFASDEDSVLFATDSFWEGVDAPGTTLRLVVIVKLPFRVPTDPVFRARQEALDREGRSGFFSLALPEATMKLKQGFGRLLRNTLDSGIVLILDSRVVNKQYGRWMLRALPDSFHPETTTSGVAQKIEDFLYK